MVSTDPCLLSHPVCHKAAVKLGHYMLILLWCPAQTSSPGEQDLNPVKLWAKMYFPLLDNPIRGSGHREVITPFYVAEEETGSWDTG